MNHYEVRKQLHSTIIAEIAIDKNVLKDMKDDDILLVVNRMLVLNNAKVRVSNIETKTISHNMVTTDDEIVTFIIFGSIVYIKYCTYYYTFTLKEK